MVFDGILGMLRPLFRALWGNNGTGQGWQVGCYFCLMTSSLNSLLCHFNPQEDRARGQQQVGFADVAGGDGNQQEPKEGWRKGWEITVQSWIMLFPIPFCPQMAAQQQE